MTTNFSDNLIDVDLTDEMIKDARELIGVPLRRMRHNTEATDLAIGRWARSIGDRDPLWLDREYAARSAFGKLVAPPCWLYSVDNTVIVPRLAGLHAIYVGTTWEFFHWVRLGDEICVSARLLDVQEKHGKFCGRMVLQVGEVTYRNQYDQIVARAISRTMRIPRKQARERGIYLERAKSKYTYTAEELSSILAAYDAESIRGGKARMWEGVQLGEELPAIVRGPLTTEEIVQFIGATCPSICFNEFLPYRRRHPYAAFRDPDLGIWDGWEASMLDNKVARLFGFSYMHDAGIDRVSWMSNLVVNWMSDHGFLKKLDVNLLYPNYVGDTSYIKGKVVGKTEEPENAVDIEIWCENQFKQVTAKGTGTVVLPSKRIG